jgi:hypothetical protein
MNVPADRDIRRERSISRWKRAYRPISLALAIIFALVGLVFLLTPESVHNVFNAVTRILGMIEPTGLGGDFYRILAVAYMYIVTLLAFSMYRYPENRYFLVLLINAKSVSAILSFLFFVFLHPYLIYLSNGIVDGAIAFGLLVLFIKTKGSQT